MEPSEELHNLLRCYEEAGEKAGTGSFGLDPKRALELLKEQGQLRGNAPLYLLRALYLHTQGQTIIWRRTLRGYLLSYSQPREALSVSTYRTLAEGAFESLDAKLSFVPEGVLLSACGGLEGRFPSRLKELFEQSKDRLMHYPITGLWGAERSNEVWLSGSFPEGELELRLPFRVRSVEWVTTGISFFERCSLWARLTVFDDDLRPDLSLTHIPESDRKALWLSRAEELLHQHLESVLEKAERIELDSRFLADDEHTLLRMLPYLLSLPAHATLRRNAEERVFFQDVFEHHWSVRELLLHEEQEGSLLVVPEVPSERPTEQVGSRPVLLWRGDTKLYGEPLFRKLQSGAGYLYSLRRGEEIRSRFRHRPETLGAVTLSFGELALKPVERPEARLEVELVGERRGSKTVYLDEPAPSGLRLRWRSPREVACWSDARAFQDEFRHGTVRLVNRHFDELEPNADWLLSLLQWSEATTDLSTFERLREAKLFQSVSGEFLSAAEIEAMDEVPVLEDRSATLPIALPYPVVLWWNALFERFGWPTRDVRLELRRALWREQGREKWLLRSEPSTPSLSGVIWFHTEQPWLWGRVEQGRSGGRLAVWREGRLLGERSVSELPDDLVALYQDDEFPADDYWAGPDPLALRELLARLPEPPH